MSASDTTLLTTPLNALHIELGARMVPFAGYSMPVQYPAGLMAEHHHTRKAAGLFDVSHMGQLRLSGPDACAAFESLMPVDVIDLPVGKQRYGLLLTDEGTIIDDLMFVNCDVANGGDIFVIVNGACKHGDLAHIQERIGSRCTITPQFDRALLALQGPQAVTALARLAPGVEKLVFMTGGDFTVDTGTQKIDVFLTRSGYTGEDGFELYVDVQHAAVLWNALMAAGESRGLVPTGLACRDTLRLEAGMPLYGHELNLTTAPVQAGLGKVVALSKEGDFVGRAASEKGVSADAPVLVGLVGEGKRAARADYEVYSGENKVGVVTSGALSPTLEYPIAMAFVDPSVSELGTIVDVDIRGTRLPYTVTALPFYSRKKN